MHRFWLFYIFVLLAAVPAFTQDSRVNLKPSETQKDSVITKSPKGAMIRSIVVPGWGQWYNEKKLKSAVIFLGEMALVADAIVLNQYVQNSTTEDEKLFYEDNRSQAIWWLGAAILYSMADAFVDAHMYNFDESPDLVQVDFGKNKINIQCTVSFEKIGDIFRAAW